MIYNFRLQWGSVFLFGLVVLIFIYDVIPRLKLLHQFHRDEKQLQKELQHLTITKDNNLKKFSKMLPIKKPFSQVEPLLRLTNLAQRHGLFIQTIEFNSSQKNELSDTVMAHFLAEGRAYQLRSFLLELLQQVYLMNIKLKIFVLPSREKSLQSFAQGDLQNYPEQNLGQNGLIALSVDILFYREHLTGLSEIKTEVNGSQAFNPFCNHHFTHFIERSYADHLRSLPLETFKMVGYIHQKKKSIALIRLPNNFIYSVQINELIGEEQARVLDIQPKQIILRLPDRTRKNLTL